MAAVGPRPAVRPPQVDLPARQAAASLVRSWSDPGALCRGPLDRQACPSRYSITTRWPPRGKYGTRGDGFGDRRPGATGDKLTGRLAAAVNRMTLIRMIRALASLGVSRKPTAGSLATPTTTNCWSMLAPAGAPRRNQFARSTCGSAAP